MDCKEFQSSRSCIASYLLVLVSNGDPAQREQPGVRHVGVGDVQLLQQGTVPASQSQLSILSTDQSAASIDLASSCSTLSSALAGSLTVRRRLLLVAR